MKRIAAATGMALAVVLSSTGILSAAPLAGFALVTESRHFAFYSRDKARADADKTERYVNELETLFGQELKGRTEYYRCEHAEEIAAATGRYASGVTSVAEGRIFSIQDFHAHELVHLVAGQLGHAGNFFDEGLAVALAHEQPLKKDGLEKAVRARSAMPMSELVRGFDRMDQTTGYALAGSFMSHLIRTQGIAKLAQFLRACGPKGGDPTTAFASAFGTTLEEAGSAWKATL
jgi:hypothetical protein